MEEAWPCGFPVIQEEERRGSRSRVREGIEGITRKKKIAAVAIA